MSQLMLKMAKQAAQDANLFAAHIERYGQHASLSWPQIASELQIDMLQLSKLALCRYPRSQTFSQDIAYTAQYVGMKQATLAGFIHRAHGEPLGKAESAKRPFFKFNWDISFMFKRRGIAAGLITIIVLLFATFAFAQPAKSEATFVLVSGQATIQQKTTFFLIIPQSKESQLTAGDIMTVRQADRITLTTDSSGQLRLYDGSTIDLFENTSIELAELITTDETYRVQLNLLSGRILNRVTKLLGSQDAYEIRTPSSTASVRGTVFTVEVISAASSYFSVTEGLVNVQMGEQQVDVAPGNEVTAVTGQTLQLRPQPMDDLAPAETEASPSTQPEPTQQSTNEPPATINTTPDNRAATPPTQNPSPTKSAEMTATLLPSETPSLATAVSPTHTKTAPPQSTDTPPAQQTSQPPAPNTAVPTAPSQPTAIPPTSVPTAQPATATPLPATAVPPTTAPATAVPPTTIPPTATSIPPTDEPALVTLCHIPPGNPDNAHTIQVDASAVQAHLDHGDYLGPCQ